MTDDQSDDRMDRARRIREMREGARPEEQADDDGTDADGGAGADPDDGADPDQGAEAGPESTDDEFPGDWEGAADAADAGDEDPPAAEDDSGAEDPIENGVPQIPGVDLEDTSVDATELAQQAGLSTDADAAEAAGGGLGGAGTGGTAAESAGADEAEPAGPVGMAGASDARRRTVAENETRVLEFALGDERYCLDIEHVEEIVKRETVTRVPNTPDYVEGVVDLRGQITTILDPKVLFDIDVEGSKELIVVFDPDDFEDQGAIGWLVDDVNQVMPVADSEVNESPVDRDHVNGVVDRDGEFVIWTRPELAVEDAAG